MILYVDSSSLAKLYAEEPGSPDFADLMNVADAVASSAITYAEIRSALARRRRERSLTPAQFATAREQFESDWATLIVVPCDDALARHAGALAEKHALRGADAVHLASFERLLVSTDDDDVEFSCADERLSRAARKLG